MSKARRASFGTVRKRRDRYFAEYTGPDKQRHTPGRGFLSKEAARRWLWQEQQLIIQGLWNPPRAREKEKQAQSVTLESFIKEQYLPYKRSPSSNCRATTVDNYEEQLTGRVLAPRGRNLPPALSRFAQMRLSEINRRAAGEWWQAVETAFPKSAHANYKAHARLVEVFNYAVDLEIIQGSPLPLPFVKRPPSKEAPLLTEEQLLQILNAYPEERRLAVVLCLICGLRSGETLALEPKHLEISGGEKPQVLVHVEGTLKGDTVSKLTINPPKTKDSRRVVPLSNEYVPLALKHLDRYAARKPARVFDSALGKHRDFIPLFPTQRGNPLLRSLFSRQFKKITHSLGIDGVTPHKGRHFLTTRLSQHGATPKEIGLLLGQRDVTTITETYLRPDEKAARAHWTALQQTLGERSTGEAEEG